MYFKENEDNIAFQYGKLIERFEQLKRLIKDKENHTMIYTSDICRVLDIKPPKKEVENEETGDE